MTGFVYKWTNTINGKWYIGSHKGTTDDGYRHSGEIMSLAEKKYGLENFIREILFEGDYVKDKIRSVIESKFLRSENAANNPMSYNRSNITGPDCFSEETRQKMSQSMMGKNTGPLSEEHKNKISMANKGQKHGPLNKEHRQKISIALTGRKLDIKHIANISNGTKGKTRTNEHCNNISIGLIGRTLTKEHCNNISKGKKDKSPSKESNIKRSLALTGRAQKKTQCPYCNLIGGISTMGRWHFDNCKDKK